MRTFRWVLIDVFTDRALAGNPLAVFTDARNLDAGTMQAIAREMNLSETVFVLPATEGGDARIRIFTPALEMPFAGHPTLGAAFVLATPLQRPHLVLETGAGKVAVRFVAEGPRITFGWMSQPLPKRVPFADGDALLAALGVRQAALPVEAYENGPRHVMVCLASRDEVARLEPDHARLRRLVRPVSCFAADGTSVKTRMFAPGSGVVEDPATGSAAGPLAVHLLRHGRIRAGEEIAIEQGAEIGRPSQLFARVEGTGDAPTLVEVGGSAVTVGRGELRLP